MSKFTITSDGARRSMRASPVLANSVEAGLTPAGAGPELMPTQGQVPNVSSRLHLRAGNQRLSMRITFNWAARGSSRVA